MITNSQFIYLQKLKKLYNTIPKELEREIFYILCKQYQSSINNTNTTKFVSKEEILQGLIDKGLLQAKIDNITHEAKLPDDRSIRLAVQKLIRNGLPILSSSKTKGYFICDNISEIEQPYLENHKRALSLLAKEKGFKQMQGFVLGQLDITEIDLESEEFDLT